MMGLAITVIMSAFIASSCTESPSRANEDSTAVKVGGGTARKLHPKVPEPKTMARRGRRRSSRSRLFYGPLIAIEKNVHPSALPQALRRASLVSNHD